MPAVRPRRRTMSVWLAAVCLLGGGVAADDAAAAGTEG